MLCLVNSCCRLFFFLHPHIGETKATVVEAVEVSWCGKRHFYYEGGENFYSVKVDDSKYREILLLFWVNGRQ